ncbi:MAG TPA: mannonate dehydratase, partial [Conexibacter sp.]|nr:mannonate dehydratase [Conexibacter sp.]
VWRTSMEHPVRGDARATAYDHALAGEGNKVEFGDRLIDRRVDRDIEISAEQVWDNYAYFLDAVLPVAEQAGIKLAQHPDDPPVETIDGVARVFNSTEAFVRAEQLSKGSPAWGLDLCVGTISERGGAAEVEKIISTFGPRGKILYVHFRDVLGTVPKFTEVFLGEGNFDPPTVIRQLIDVGFDGWLQDDHVPFMDDDTRWGHRARAHEIGYIQGVLAALR